jgi:nucleoside-diphosphate-sugar epimerase
MDAELEPGTVMNIGTGTTTTLNRVIEIVGEILDRRVSRRDDGGVPGDPERTEADVTKAADLLGWKPLTSLDVGVLAQVDHQSRAASEERLTR